MKTRREHGGVVGAILLALDREGPRGRDARLTNVAARANVAYDRLQAYLTELQTAGLVTGERVPTLTPKGREYVRHYVRWMETLRRYGLHPEVARKSTPIDGNSDVAAGN